MGRKADRRFADMPPSQIPTFVWTTRKGLLRCGDKPPRNLFNIRGSYSPGVPIFTLKDDHIDMYCACDREQDEYSELETNDRELRPVPRAADRVVRLAFTEVSLGGVETLSV